MYISKISKGLPYIVTFNALQFIVATAFYSIAAKVLAKADLGLVSTLTFLHVVFTVIAPLALPIAGTKYVAEFVGRDKRGMAANVAASIIRMVLMLSLFFLTIFGFASFTFVSAFNWPQDTLIFLIITFIASFIATIRLTYLALIQGLQLFDRYAVSNALALVISRLAGLILILLNFGLTGFAMGMVGGEAAGLVLSIFYYHGSLPKATNPYDSKLLLKFSLPIYVMSIVTVFSDWTDRVLFLALSHDLGALGIYELAIRGAGSLSVIWALIDVIILPVFSETYGHKGRGELTRPLKKALRYLVFMYFPAALGLAAISKTVMALLFGWEYITGSVPLAILSVFSMLTAFSIIMGSTLKSIGETKVFVRASLTSLIINGFVVAVLTPSFSMYGAVAGKVTAIIVVFLYVFYELKHKVRIEVDLQGLWKGTLASLVLVAPLQFFENFSLGNPGGNPAVAIGVEILLGLACYVLVLFLLKALTRDDFELLRRLTPKSLSKIIDLFERMLVR